MRFKDNTRSSANRAGHRAAKLVSALHFGVPGHIDDETATACGVASKSGRIPGLNGRALPRTAWLSVFACSEA